MATISLCAARSLATVAGRVAVSRLPKRQAKAAIDVVRPWRG
jgi:hypothetical protein